MENDGSDIYSFEDFEGFGEDAYEVWCEIKKLGGTKHLNHEDLSDFAKGMMRVLRLLSDFNWHTRIEIDMVVGQKEATRRLRRLRKDPYRFIIDCRRTKADSRIFEYRLRKELRIEAHYPMSELWKDVRIKMRLIEDFFDWRGDPVPTDNIRKFVEDRFGFSFSKLEEERQAILEAEVRRNTDKPTDSKPLR